MSTSFTFKFSQTRELRESLEQLFINNAKHLAGLAAPNIAKLREMIDLSQPSLDKASSEVFALEQKLKDNEKVIKRKQLASKQAKLERSLLIQEYNLVKGMQADYEKYINSYKDEIRFWEVCQDIQKAIEESEHILAIGIFCSVLAHPKSPFGAIYGKQSGYSDFLPELTIWAGDKIKGYCIGFVARAKANNDLSLEGLSWFDLVDLAIKDLPKYMVRFSEVKLEDRLNDTDTIPNLCFRFAIARNYHPIVTYATNAGFGYAIKAEYHGKDPKLVNAAIELGISTYNHWQAFPSIGCYAAIIAKLQENNAKLEQQAALPSGLYSSVYDAYPNLDKQALKVAKELYDNKSKDYIAKSLRSFNGKSTWDKDISTYTSDLKWITDGHALYNLDAIKEESLARFTFAIGKHKPNAQVILNKFTNTSYQNIRVLGTRRNSSDIGWYTYFTTDDNKIVVANYGYIKLLETFKMSVARLVYHSDGIFVALDHKDRVLAAIMGLKPENGTDKTDVLTSIAFDAVLSFYDQGNGNANHPSNKHLLASAKVA